MRAHFFKYPSYYILILCCIISRLFTSVYYIEDIDSLRFAYSVVDEYNLSKLQPHFPGYAVFCFIANILYEVIGNMAISFSLIGGISTFIIIYFSLKLLNHEINTKEGIFIILFIFFNPMMWIMSNRYMPDLLGLSVCIGSFYLLFDKDIKYKLLGCFLFGLLTGIRLSYLPILIFPFFYTIIYNSNINKIKLIISLCLGVLIWLLPMIWITGFENLVSLAYSHTLGHFTDYGGTFFTENNWFQRIKYMFHTIWSDGLGGYWVGRSNFTLILLLLLIPIILLTIKKYKNIIYKNDKIKYLIISGLIYTLWILLFQNIIFKSRHVMPLVLIIILIFSSTINQFWKSYKKINILYSILFISVLGLITINLSIQHKNPTSINKIGNYLKSKNKKLILVSTPLINYYLKSMNINAEYIDIEFRSEKINIEEHNSKPLFVIGNFVDKFKNDKLIVYDTVFYHNPYVNRMWSKIKLYSNQKL